MSPLPPGVNQSDLEPDMPRCGNCGRQPCECDRLEQQMEQERLEKAMGDK